ncbi:MAG: hypothetical protein AB2L11_07870 [Syntrophobacteraceae bacterium]
MKQYVIDQLRESDYEQIEDYLNNNTDKAILDGVYWVDLPKELYTDIQRDHIQCWPYYFAINLTLRSVAFELLIRSRQVMRCNCIGYADPKQREYILNFSDHLLEHLNIRI